MANKVILGHRCSKCKHNFRDDYNESGEKSPCCSDGWVERTWRKGV